MSNNLWWTLPQQKSGRQDKDHSFQECLLEWRCRLKSYSLFRWKIDPLDRVRTSRGLGNYHKGRTLHH